MNERLLQYIWQHRFFSQRSLLTTDSSEVGIIHPGTVNSHQGPDFLNAKIRIGNTVWVGHVELHIRSSDWKLHGHSSDTHYRNVILHAVWEHDDPVDLGMPTLELKPLVPKWLLDRYDLLLHTGSFIPCAKQIDMISESTIRQWMQILLRKRLQHKAAQIRQSLHQNQFHWEETFWHMLARNFGYPVNHDLFFAIASSIPLNWLSKYRKQPDVLEALLFGQAGMLEKDFQDDYPQHLQKEYRFLQRKHSIRPVFEPVHLLRMRPAGFPTIRLSQLAMLIAESHHLFSKIREEDDLQKVRQMFRISTHHYWVDHYLPDQPSSQKTKWLGLQMTDNLLMNTVIPCIYAYGEINGQPALTRRSMEWLAMMPAENNRIIRHFRSIGISCKQAAESQALLFLKKQYCDPRLCLSCDIGKSIVSGESFDAGNNL